MFLIPPRLRQLFQKKRKGRNSRAFESGLAVAELDIFPAEAAVRQRWFSLSSREREVAALIRMGYKNYEIADILGVEYGTIQTHLQNIFRKFNLRSRGEIRHALRSWPAEEWWNYHHG